MGGLQGFLKINKWGGQNKWGVGQNIKKSGENRIILINFINFAQHRYS